MSESSWFTLEEQMRLLDNLRDVASEIVRPDTYGHNFLINHVLNFLETHLVKDENRVHVDDNWMQKSPNKFVQYFIEGLNNRFVPVEVTDEVTGEEEIQIKTYLQLLSNPEFDSAASAVRTAENFHQLIEGLLKGFPLLNNGWLSGGSETRDITIITNSLLGFISKVAYEEMVRIFSESEQDNELRDSALIPLALFINTFGTGQKSVENIFELHDFLERYMRENGFVDKAYLDRYDFLERISSKRSLTKEETKERGELSQFINASPMGERSYIYSSSGESMITLPGFETTGGYSKKIVKIVEKTTVRPPNTFIIDVYANFKRSLPVLKDEIERFEVKNGELEPEADYIRRLMDTFLKDIAGKLDEMKDYLNSIVPANVAGEFQAYNVPFWESFLPNNKIDDLHYFTASGSSGITGSMTITLQDNISLIMEYAPVLTKMLMDLEGIKPLNRSKTFYSEYDGGGSLDFPRTIQEIMRTGTISIMQRETERFKEKDKANMIFILDRSSSMEFSNVDVCAKCGAPKSYHCECWTPIVAPSFRYCQMLLTLLAYIFRGFIAEAWYGFIDNLNTPMLQFFGEDWEKLIHAIWTTEGGTGTDYYNITKVESGDYSHLMSGRNKKFLFIITDAEERDVNWSDIGEKSPVESLVMLNQNQYLNLIYCIIQTPRTNSRLGFTGSQTADDAHRTYTRTMQKFLILNIISGRSGLMRNLEDNPDPSFKIINNTLVSSDMERFLDIVKNQLKYSSDGILLHHIFLYENWETTFMTDSYKVAIPGELQRLVRIIKTRNLLELAEGW